MCVRKGFGSVRAEVRAYGQFLTCDCDRTFLPVNAIFRKKRSDILWGCLFPTCFVYLKRTYKADCYVKFYMSACNLHFKKSNFFVKIVDKKNDMHIWIAEVLTMYINN